MLLKIEAFFISVIAFFCSVFNIPYYATGESIDMSGFTLTFEEQFDGDTIDRSVWSGHYVYGDESEARKGAYWNNNIPYTENGNLVIPLTYLDDGMGGTGAGWYSAGIDTDSDSPEGFSQKYGYFECRCILPESSDGWAAFWLMNDGVYNVDGSGTDGTEIDVFESTCFGDRKSNAVTSNLHYDGYDESHKAFGARKTLIKGNPYEEFNTYGLEWNENEYIFYINGVEAFRTDFGGVSQNEEYLILSFEIPGENGIPSGRDNSAAETEYFIVDYVRAYQYNDLMK